MREFSSEEYVFFIIDKSKLNKASFGFRADYTDKTGEQQKILLDKIDKNTGEKMVKKYTIQKGLGSLRINKRNKSEIDFLRNHPNCKNSPNGYYRSDGKGGHTQINVWFSELNNEVAAKDGLRIKQLALNAANRVMELSSDASKLRQLAAVMGYSGSEVEILFKLVEHAQKMPDDIIHELDNPTFEAKALFRKGLSDKIIIQKGITYTLEDYELGIDEESAVKTIATDKDIRSLISKKLKNQ